MRAPVLGNGLPAWLAPFRHGCCGDKVFRDLSDPFSSKLRSLILTLLVALAELTFLDWAGSAPCSDCLRRPLPQGRLLPAPTSFACPAWLFLSPCSQFLFCLVLSFFLSPAESGLKDLTRSCSRKRRVPVLHSETPIAAKTDGAPLFPRSNKG